MIHDYDDMFAGHVEQADKRQANADYMADILWKYVQPKSVIDVGCGMGFFLKSCADRDATIKGVDGEWMKDKETVIPKKTYRYADLNDPLKSTKRYDMAVSIEVGEHLRPRRSPTFVEDLCKLSDIVLFSAGVPGQGGAGHINLRYQSDWAKKFANQGYACYDPIRRRMAEWQRAFPWLMQNVLLYIKDGTPIDPLLDEHRISPRASSYLIAMHYQTRMTRMQRKVDALKAELAEKTALLEGKTPEPESE